MLENGKGIDSGQQMLVHNIAGAAVPLELQNKSMVVHRSIRVLAEHCISPGSFHVRLSRQKLIRASSMAQ